MDFDLRAAQKCWARMSASEIIHAAVLSFGTGVVAATRGNKYSAVLLDLVTRRDPEIPVVYIHDEETSAFVDRLDQYFSLNLKKREAGPDKVETMREALREFNANAIFYGIRAYQTPERGKARVIELGEDGIYRIHPLLYWTTTQVRMHAAKHNLPVSGRVEPENKVECGLHCVPSV